jgi:Hydrazine synthase alpha subunit middle domain/WD40-like Beta Propeller Repeat
MSLLLHRYRKERSRASAKGFLSPAALFFSSILAACGGSGDGVSIGSGQDQDPVVIDFPIAYIKAPLPLDEQGQLQQPDLRELITFNLGADLYFRDRASPSALDINITESVLNGLGDVRDVEIAYDGSKLLFAMRGPADENLDLDDEDQPTWNIWEYVFATAELRRVIASDLTAEIGHDIAPHYLPDGRIIFSSTRQLRSSAVLLDEGKPQFQALDEDFNEMAFVLHVMDADGSNIEQVSYNQSHDFDPSVMSNGQVVFSRWDHMGVNDSVNLYRMNPDGSALELLYGQNSHDSGTDGATVQFMQPRELEDGRIMALVRPFSDTDAGGDIMVLDTPAYLEITQPNKDNAGLAGPAQEPATILEVSTLPDALSSGGRFRSVFPIQDGTGRLLTSWNQCRVTEEMLNVPCTPDRIADPAAEAAPPIYGIWIYDPRDNTQLPVVPPEEGFIFTEAVSADPRAAPPVILDSDNSFAPDPDLVGEGAGVISIRSVYDIDGGATANIEALADPAQTTADQRAARFLRVVKAVSIPDEDIVDLDNTAFGRSAQQGMKEIVGYAPIEPDGSVMVKVPANVALAVSVLDAGGRRISGRHQNWLQLRPGQLLECNGCHMPQSGISHGRADAFASAWAGAPTAGIQFPNTDPALFVGEVGETMAEIRARITCGATNCSSLEPSVDVVYEDVWTDEMAAGRPKDASFDYSYADLTTPVPTSLNCIQQWSANCRIVINYETHIHPLWTAPRPVLDDMGNPVLDGNGLPLSNDCTNCHSPIDDQAAVRVPAAQLDLTDGLSPDEPVHFNSYRELLFPDNEQEVGMGALQDVLVQVGTDPDTGDPIFATVTVGPSMSVAGANASGRFFDRFDAGQSHDGYLSPAEKRLIAEWLDVGAQYYNNPFDVPQN